jgi:hypothetical protein
MRFFNNAGPVDCADHYCLDPIERINLSELDALIGQKRYFVLHAPRQTGKTSSLLALMHHLNRQGRYRSLYLNVEAAQSAREDVGAAIQAILAELGSRARTHLGEEWLDAQWPGVLAQGGPEHALTETLTRWARHSDRPLVLLIDEIDALIGDSLVSVLRQIRSGYDKRPTDFPQTVILCGVRDVRDYRIHSSRSREIVTGGSAFNIKAESIRMGNFSAADCAALYRQHTEETGQRFTADAIDLVWHLTRGQPWLVNALGYQLCFRDRVLRERTVVIDRQHVQQAAEVLIQRRDTHLDQLADKLREPRVHRVIAPILAGDDAPEHLPEDDVQYVRDLGLITTDGQIEIANAIYREVIPRQLTYTTSLTIAQEPAWFVQPDGRLDLPKLIAAFQVFFREHSEHWMERFKYKEAGPQLLLQAFLQRIVNGGGRVEREYGFGRMRTDLLIVWPYGAGTPDQRMQKAVLELKILHKGLEPTIAAGLQQTHAYCDRSGADEAHLLIFDRGPRDWGEKLFHRSESFKGVAIEVWGM